MNKVIVLHGSLHCDLATLEPIRNSRDSSEFGDQPAIYATQDPLWALFFAVLDRNRLEGSIHNGAITVKTRRNKKRKAPPSVAEDCGGSFCTPAWRRPGFVIFQGENLFSSRQSTGIRLPRCTTACSNSP